MRLSCLLYLLLSVSLSIAESEVPLTISNQNSSGSTYHMTIYARRALGLMGIVHHDYRYTEMRADGSSDSFEVNWGIEKIDWRHPLQGLTGQAVGKMGSVASSDAIASHHPTVTRVFSWQITAEAYFAQKERAQMLNSGGGFYSAIGRHPNSFSCITAGIPTVAQGDVRPGIGIFAAPRIHRIMERRGLNAR